jgi:hypothetical protein
MVNTRATEWLQIYTQPLSFARVFSRKEKIRGQAGVTGYSVGVWKVKMCLNMALKLASKPQQMFHHHH